MRIVKYLEKQTRNRHYILCIALISLVGTIDLITGDEFSLSIFYLLPVILAAWHLGKRPAILISLLCALAWLLADQYDGGTYLNPWVIYWNALARFGLFLIVSITLTRLRTTLQHEYQQARDIQQRLLPKKMPSCAGFQFAGASVPSNVVGGDYFDVMKPTDHSIALCIGDVMGHGISAALIMSNLQAAVRLLSQTVLSPGQLCRQLSTFVQENTAGMMFVSFFFCLIDCRSHRLVYSNAGHNPPLLLRSDGTLHRFDQAGTLLGVQDTMAYAETSLTLMAGDQIVLYTDGITEAARNSEESGEARLIEEMRKNQNQQPDVLQKHLLEAAISFNGGTLADDMTVLVVSVR
jgi:serine phosphatase RsbU (regulator of sigma subunit)